VTEEELARMIVKRQNMSLSSIESRQICCAYLASLDRERRMRKALNTPEIHDFARGVVLEAQHQRQRWGTTHDAGKTNADWFWLVGYLASKALTAAGSGNVDKALHHTISTAAALANWHAALNGDNHEMRPGIDPAALSGQPVQGDGSLRIAPQPHVPTGDDK